MTKQIKDERQWSEDSFNTKRHKWIKEGRKQALEEVEKIIDKSNLINIGIKNNLKSQIKKEMEK